MFHCLNFHKHSWWKCYHQAEGGRQGGDLRGEWAPLLPVSLVCVKTCKPVLNGNCEGINTSRRSSIPCTLRCSWWISVFCESWISILWLRAWEMELIIFRCEPSRLENVENAESIELATRVAKQVDTIKLSSFNILVSGRQYWPTAFHVVGSNIDSLLGWWIDPEFSQCVIKELG